jgi:hypothetical protein
MRDWARRLIVYGFLGLFGVVGIVFVVIAVGSAIHREAFIRTALRTRGTVTEMRPTRSTRTGAGTYVPVFRYTADDGETYLVVSDVSVGASAFSTGEKISVLYQQGHPESARIDAFTPLWLYSVIFAIGGVVFASVPIFVLLNRNRRS